MSHLQVSQTIIILNNPDLVLTGHPAIVEAEAVVQDQAVVLVEALVEGAVAPEEAVVEDDNESFSIYI
jgi:hypothetical protein